MSPCLSHCTLDFCFELISSNKMTSLGSNLAVSLLGFQLFSVHWQILWSNRKSSSLFLLHAKVLNSLPLYDFVGCVYVKLIES